MPAGERELERGPEAFQPHNSAPSKKGDGAGTVALAEHDKCQIRD